MLRKTAIVTGANGNLGQAVVRKFIDKDYHVIGTVRQKQERGNQQEESFEEAVVDLLDQQACQELVDQVISANKFIDVAVLTAGGFSMGDVAHTKSSDLSRQYQLNFETAYNIARPVFTQMIQQNSGRLFFIGSRAGLDTKKGKGVVAYSLTKSLLVRLAELMNEEAKGKNVVVSVIVPSVIDTPQNRESMPESDFSTWVLPSQIAEVIYFYAGEEAAIIREPVIKVYNRS